MSYQKLVAAAQKAKRFSYSPFSKFKVGAAVVTRSGTIYTGCNIEISSFALTICAERTALFKAVSEGERNFVAVAIASGGSALTPPCGACRQVLMDLAGDIDVVMTNHRGKKRVMRLRDLFPHPFRATNFIQRKKRTGQNPSRENK
ncbi:MAG: cytidine deaminase [Bacteroidota bacterium]